MSTPAPTLQPSPAAGPGGAAAGCQPAPLAASGLPADVHTPPFDAPWQAQAFATTLALHERGLFSWPEWAAALTAAIRRAQAAGDPDDGSTYYRHWLDALEQLLLAKGLAHDDSLHALEHAWEAAAARTPHGQPVELSDAERALAGLAPAASSQAAGQAS